ncbi:subtilisin-like protease-like protein [Cucurbitaria berberidis CBS 394.84]|uniref:Subtilisin-like protease-like protein n=1 Tax=Cucurbitaria berberidis CBS 394.84 TaxID=1168544 RepID=A0A9P4GPQ9_9PLEO|nr:subtilisin-like protease-like protein [Cucurbitaria berberidis CBS 394.84]KAF1850363.1 subtilisin-like protease-like protein [Cucurbitaria berberidis CBS 394.84]
MQFFTRFLALAATAVPFIAQAAPLAPRAAELIPGKYIIQLKPGTDIASIAAHHNKVREIHARNLARRDDAEVSAGIERQYDIGDFKGYAGSFDAATIEELKALPEVLVVEQDFVMYLAQDTAAPKAAVTQNNAPWGLASISSRTRGATDYIYDSSAGQGTFSYIVDTGIRTTHVEFEGRAVWGFNAVNNINTDNNGHGTHVSGTIGSKTYGVAKKTTLVGVKVFEGNSGTASAVIAGFEWATNDIVQKGRETTAVINMSLGGPASTTWDAAITASYNKGVLSVVAAGNENRLASLVSPARSPEVLAVGNVQPNDVRYQGTTGSNYGPVVDIWAAGTGVLSTYGTSDSATASLSGTSMASPHVAGLVSYLRGLEGASSAKAIRARVIALATPDRVSDTKGAANLLAFNGASQ